MYCLLYDFLGYLYFGGLCGPFAGLFGDRFGAPSDHDKTRTGASRMAVRAPAQAVIKNEWFCAHEPLDNFWF